jgi:tRNA(Ile)-lysidine synthase TilS/MesJ
MKICTHCVLPETFPGITFDERGMCSFCARHEQAGGRESSRERFRTAFLDLLREVRGQHTYDALVAYSGGKDSTYTLKLLKEEHSLNLLSVTIDHGFTSPAALKNIETVTARLDIDHYTIRPGAATLRALFNRSMQCDVYPAKALERASAICNSCMNIVKSLLLKLAIESRIPMIVYGWSPGQAPLRSSMFKTNPAMLAMMQEAARASLEKLIGARARTFLLEERHLSLTDKSRFPTLVHPLAFLEYSEEAILNAVAELGWEAPTDTGAHSSNCLLNDFAIEGHVARHRFHPYAFEIAGLVREGCLSRAEGLKRLSAEPDRSVVAGVKKQLEGGGQP